MDAEELDRIIRTALDFGEARIAEYDLSIKASTDEVRDLAEWMATTGLRSYSEYERDKRDGRWPLGEHDG